MHTQENTQKTQDSCFSSTPNVLEHVSAEINANPSFVHLVHVIYPRAEKGKQKDKEEKKKPATTFHNASTLHLPLKPYSAVVGGVEAWNSLTFLCTLTKWEEL